MAEPGTEEKEGILPFLVVRAIKPHEKKKKMFNFKIIVNSCFPRKS
jgi:hypothetical protein